MVGAKSFFFCGIGGSGMLPLASILRGQGNVVAGSDRSLDQGRATDKFAWLERQGIALFPQNGSGVTGPEQLLVTSAAIEEDVPDVQAALRVGAARITRPQLLAQLFNAAPTGIAVGGTSGKSTTTGMIGWILHEAGLDPIVMNGAVMKNFATADTPFASALVGRGGTFVSEVDESDGSIALYRPNVALLTNITLDHKSLDELHGLFLAFVERAETAILNLDDDETRLLAARAEGVNLLTFSFADDAADFYGSNLREEPLAVSFEVTHGATGRTYPVCLVVPGRHNAANALAALAAANACGVDLETAAAALAHFQGLRRRFEVVGTREGVTVIDDFGHNPDKIAATLDTLHAFPGRLIVVFQPHGFGPLKMMGGALVDMFAAKLGADDILILSDPAYFGGTVDRSVGSADIVAAVRERGREAEHIPTREAITARIAALVRSGDRVVVMGARDDSLSAFAAGLLEAL